MTLGGTCVKQPSENVTKQQKKLIEFVVFWGIIYLFSPLSQMELQS